MVILLLGACAEQESHLECGLSDLPREEAETKYRVVAQLVRAFGRHPRGREFESHQPYQKIYKA